MATSSRVEQPKTTMSAIRSFWTKPSIFYWFSFLLSFKHFIIIAIKHTTKKNKDKNEINRPDSKDTHEIAFGQRENAHQLTQSAAHARHERGDKEFAQLFRVATKAKISEQLSTRHESNEIIKLWDVCLLQFATLHGEFMNFYFFISLNYFLIIK